MHSWSPPGGPSSRERHGNPSGRGTTPAHRASRASGRSRQGLRSLVHRGSGGRWKCPRFGQFPFQAVSLAPRLARPTASWGRGTSLGGRCHAPGFVDQYRHSPCRLPGEGRGGRPCRDLGRAGAGGGRWDPVALLVTGSGSNSYPVLPLREREQVVVRIARFEKEPAHPAFRVSLPGPPGAGVSRPNWVTSSRVPPRGWGAPGRPSEPNHRRSRRFRQLLAEFNCCRWVINAGHRRVQAARSNSRSGWELSREFRHTDSSVMVGARSGRMLR